VWSRAPPRPSDNGMRSAPGFCGLACTAAGRRRNCLAYDFMAWGRYELTAKRALQTAEVSIYGIEYKEGIHPLLIHFGHPERLPESISRPRSSANFLCPSYRRDRTPRSAPGWGVEPSRRWGARREARRRETWVAGEPSRRGESTGETGWWRWRECQHDHGCSKEGLW